MRRRRRNGGRADGKERELEKSRRITCLKSKERKFSLVGICKDVISTLRMPKLQGGGWGSNLVSEPLLLLAVLAAPELVSKLSIYSI